MKVDRDVFERRAREAIDAGSQQQVIAHVSPGEDAKATPSLKIILDEDTTHAVVGADRSGEENSVGSLLSQ